MSERLVCRCKSSSSPYRYVSRMGEIVHVRKQCTGLVEWRHWFDKCSSVVMFISGIVEDRIQICISRLVVILDTGQGKDTKCGAGRRDTGQKRTLVVVKRTKTQKATWGETLHGDPYSRQW